ncbi:MAG: nucleotidyltransferase domain-containing protein [Trueperaceae bacterium]
MLTAGSLEALADYFGKQPHVDAAFLFGSQARGHVRAGSDVDIGVLMMRAAPREPLRAVRFTNDLMDLLGRSDVDVAILNDASPLLVHRVAQEGRVLYATSNTAVAEFALRALQQYEDTKPLRELQAKQASAIFATANKGPE